jgi:site-specific DNA recombinase
MSRPQDHGGLKAPDLMYAAIYARVSTEDQGRGFSIPTQIEAGRKLADHERYTVSESHILVDEGISGTTMDRPGLRKVRELVNARAIAAVIVYDPDRLSRNLGHQLLLAEEFEQASVKLLIVSHPMEQGPEGWLFFQMRGALAEYERAKTQERTKRGMLGRAKAGNPWGGQPALGYRAIREPHKARWEIEEEEAALVRRIFAMCLSGMSTYGITEQLSRERVPTPRERGTSGGRSRRRTPGVWNEASIYKILTNEAYTGCAYFGKYRCVSKTRRVRRPRTEWIAIPVPAIIDRETFDAAQRQLERNRALATRNRKYEYLLSGGRFRCGRCGRTMTGRTPPNGSRRYSCNSLRTPHDPEHTCRGSVAADEVERQVWAAVVRVLEEPELITAEVAKQETTAEDQRAEIRQHVALIETALTRCDREAQRWADAYAAEVINLAELKGYRAEIEGRRQSLLAERETCAQRMEAIGAAVARVEALIDYCARVRQRLQTFDEAEKRLALDALEIRVTWIPQQPLDIQGSIPIDTIMPIPPRSHKRCLAAGESRA